MNRLLLFLGLSTGLLFSSCGDDVQDNVVINIPDTDEECCNAEETFLAYSFLNNGYVKELTELRDTIDNKYVLKVYSAGGKLHVGYNDLFFALIKIATDGYVRDFQVNDIRPLMTMTAMGMQHSTPTETETTVYNETFPAVRHAWVSFLMSSGDNGYWELSYKAAWQQKEIEHTPTVIEVNALPAGQNWLKSFKKDNQTYYLTLVNPNTFQTGNNTIRAYVSKQSADKKVPYLTAEETFTIEITPTMPDMGDHTSPNNTPLIKQESGIYEGNLNLSMTGLWNIHLVVKDQEGNIVAGGDNDNSGYSSLYWSVTI